MAQARELQQPVELTDPLTATAPKATPGCAVCGALYKQWLQATEKGSPAYSPSHATDLAVELSRHPHDWKKRGRA
jgi:hypothetical protein